MNRHTMNLFPLSFYTTPYYVLIKVSITFDPFMHLSLPIPVSICKLNITFIYYHKPRQCKFTVSLTKQSRTIADLKQAIMNKLKDSKHVRKRSQYTLVITYLEHIVSNHLHVSKQDMYTLQG